MADDDPFASIIDDCLYSSSQEDILTHSKFAREDEIFADDEGKSPAVIDSDRSRMQSDGTDVAGGSNQAKFTGVRTDCNEKRALGFPEQNRSSLIEVVFDGEVQISDVPEVGTGASIEPPLKKSRVSDSKSPILKGEKASPLVHCSEKMAINSEDRNKQIVVYKGGLKVVIVSPLRCFSLNGVELTEKQVIDDEKSAHNDISSAEGNPVKKKLELESNTEGVELQEGEKNVPNNGKIANDISEEDAKGNGSKNGRDDVLVEEMEGQEKRGLPCSLLGKNWGLSGNGSDGSWDRGFRAPTNERGKSVEETLGQKSKNDETVSNHLDVLRMLMTQMTWDADYGETDIFETAKRHGMTFPCSRFLLSKGE